MTYEKAVPTQWACTDHANAWHNSSIIHSTSALTNSTAFALCIAFKMLVTMLTLIVPSTVICYKKILNYLLLHRCPLLREVCFDCLLMEST